MSSVQLYLIGLVIIMAYVAFCGVYIRYPNTESNT